MESPQNIVEICVAIDAAILSIAFPIIVDRITQIGTRFSSQYISVLFDEEFPQKKLRFSILRINIKLSIFQVWMIITMMSFLFIIFPLEPLFDWNNWFINNSARLLVLVCTIVQVVLLFLWLNKVALYAGSPVVLLHYIIRNYNYLNGAVDRSNYKLKAINEIAYYALSSGDEHLQKTLLDFYYALFSSIRRNHDKSTPLVYPTELYDLVLKLNELAASDEY